MVRSGYITLSAVFCNTLAPESASYDVRCTDHLKGQSGVSLRGLLCAKAMCIE